MEIELTRAALERILLEEKRALPDEACGLLLGAASRIDDAVPTRNVHRTPQTHFEIDPQALIDAHRHDRKGGLRLLGYYHSHPTGSAEPSAVDRAMASGDGRLWAIVADGDITFWRDDEGGFVALSYTVMER